MRKVFVLGKLGDPLMPTHPARARRLLKMGRAVIHRRVPFTIRLKDRAEGQRQPVRLKLDPGSKVTGIAVVREAGDAGEVLHLAELLHKHGIREAMLRRSHNRRRRRVANLRHRRCRVSNRARPKGWLPPSLLARVHQTESWVKRYRKWLPVSAVSVESNRFDTQRLQDPEISGVEYQRGELFGYDVREYLLEKWGRRCAYCGAGGLPLEIEHIVPRIRGGSDRVSNLALACRSCNDEKSARTAEEFGHPEVQTRARRSMRDASAVSSTRKELLGCLAATGLPIEQGTGARTKYNRERLGLPKSHALDALCVGTSTPERFHGLKSVGTLVIGASGRGAYRRAAVDSSGFPRAHRSRQKSVAGFQTGDLVRGTMLRGKHAGTHEGTVVVRRSKYFDLKHGRRRIVQGVGARRCELLQRFDGYTYEIKPL